MVATKTVVLNVVVVALCLFPGIAGAQRSGASGYIDDRIGQLQQTVSDLTRHLEQLKRQNQQLQQQLEKMQASYEQRIERLEKGGPAKPTAAGKPPTKPQTPR
jgi:TolA-binding protein